MPLILGVALFNFGLGGYMLGYLDIHMISPYVPHQNGHIMA